MAVKLVSTWITSDNKQFQGLLPAQQHERSLILQKMMNAPENHKAVRAMNLSGCQAVQIADFIAERFFEIQAAYLKEDVLD